MYFTVAFIASLAISANALVTPHPSALERRHHHAALAKARAPVPGSFFVPRNANESVPRKQIRKRCKPRPQPSKAPSSTSASSTAPSQSANQGAANAVQRPSPASSSSNPAKSSAAPPPPPPPPPQPQQPPPPPKQAAPPPPPPPPQHPSPPPQTPPPAQGGSVHIGQGTFYGTGLGACGITNQDTDHIAAVSKLLFDSFPGYNGVNPNSNPLCGKQTQVEYQGKTVTVTLTDRCEACAYNDLDFSPSAFNILADPSVGRITGIKWSL